MVKMIFAVYDVKTGAYNGIMVQNTEGEAIRTMSMVVNDKEKRSIEAKCPQDFRLDFLGEVNFVTGEINQIKAPKHVMDLAQLVETK